METCVWCEEPWGPCLFWGVCPDPPAGFSRLQAGCKRQGGSAARTPCNPVLGAEGR